MILEYYNGNNLVNLFGDGTKTRILLNTECVRRLSSYDVRRFETVDLKITNYCDAGCSYCHENSTVKGKHADFNDLTNTLKLFAPYTEIAIGGGNPLDYPLLKEFLIECKSRKLIPNITINGKHINDNTIPFISELINDRLLFSIGISIDNLLVENKNKLESLINSNKIVYHAILGIHDFEDIIKKYNSRKILVLGYKVHGRGFKHGLKVIDHINEYSKQRLNECIEKYISVSWCFDTLATEQLNLDKNSNFYMGDEGENSLYIDCVKMQYTESSYSTERFDLKPEDQTPTEFYKLFKNRFEK